MARPLEQCHKTEIEVAEIISFPKKSPERLAKWRELTNRGNFIYNKNVVEKGEGNLIPLKRPNTNVDAFEFASCDQCLGLVMKKDLWRHKQNCVKQKQTSQKEKKLKPFVFR